MGIYLEAQNNHGTDLYHRGHKWYIQFTALTENITMIVPILHVNRN